MIHSNSSEIDIMKSCIGGFRRYSFAAPVHIDAAGESLGEMLGMAINEIEDPARDAYSEAVHPDDRPLYSAFIEKAAAAPCRITQQYRLISKTGAVIHVQDTLTSREENGVMYGYSTLADVTAIKQENEDLHRINEVVPCGIIRYTCSAKPRVTYVNDQMLRIMHYSPSIPGIDSLLDQYKSDLYTMIAVDERERFRRFLDLVYSKEKPTAGEISAIRFDGTRVRLYGWISKTVSEDGEEEFQSVCMDATERYDRKRRDEQQRYIRALTQIYDEIFEFDTLKNSVRFVHGDACSLLGVRSDMPMVLGDAMGLLIDTVVIPDDRKKLRDMLAGLSMGDMDAETRPTQLEFRMINGNDTLNYAGILIRTGPGCHLFCCRNITPQLAAARLQTENEALRSMNEQMQEFVMQFTDGLLAFEIRDDMVRPLYYSDNISNFFRYTKAEWIKLMQVMTPIPAFVSKCHISYDDFLDLLENSEAEFINTDAATGNERRYKAIRTSKNDDSACYYVIIYDITGKAPPAAAAVPRVYIRTFGYLDVFVDGDPIAFRSEKSKELFALLVDRRGGFVTSGEALSVLWEDEPATPVTLSRYRKVALRLKNTLEEYGIGDIIESVDGKRRIVAQKVRCDLYDFLSGEKQLFTGSYMQNYSWGEMTLSELEDMRNQHA